jgi:hypothetical protein
VQLGRKLQSPTSRETSSINARRFPYCHVERSETSLIIVWELEENPEILHFVRDNNSVFEFGAGIESSDYLVRA